MFSNKGLKKKKKERKFIQNHVKCTKLFLKSDRFTLVFLYIVLIFNHRLALQKLNSAAK